MDLPKEFFTIQSMLTLTGATGVVFVVTNGLKLAFEWSPKWIGLVVAQTVALVGTGVSGGSGIDYFIGFINGFLIFCTAAGASSAGGATGRAKARGPALSAEEIAEGRQSSGGAKDRFWSGWF